MNKKLFIDLDGTIAKFNVRNSLKRFDNEIGFFKRLNAYIGIEVVNELASNGNVYIISASPNAQADSDKMEWLAKYLPNVPNENVTLCRLGENKAQIIQDKYSIVIDNNCLLLDDYTKNLNEWESFGGKGIKRLTTVSDNSRGLWKGATLKDLRKINQVFA